MKKIIREIGWPRIFRYFIFGLWQWIFDLLPFSPLRIFWLRLGGATIGDNCVVDKIDFINLDRTGLKGLLVGEECFLGRGALLDLAGGLVLEKQATIAVRAVLLTHLSVGFDAHPLNKRYPKTVKGIILRRACFIGSGSIILPGIEIGEESIVAAGAVVLKSVPTKKMVAGVPAKVKKR